ncbi:hypothetical protein [Anabaena sp. PCC 7108]|uniref:hypothetical protein n=1 Tax=Anabaena sp. PCC 7108 TaxID=163908 RepID=UPI00035C1AB3|nr:hypothetical protein [Anabaena sp. PCC 7108]
MIPKVGSRYSINKRGVEQHAKLNQLQAITKNQGDPTMSNLLFTEVPVAQQEIVAGGFGKYAFSKNYLEDVTRNFSYNKESLNGSFNTNIAGLQFVYVDA